MKKMHLYLRKILKTPNYLSAVNCSLKLHMNEILNKFLFNLKCNDNFDWLLMTSRVIVKSIILRWTVVVVSICEFCASLCTYICECVFCYSSLKITLLLAASAMSLSNLNLFGKQGFWIDNKVFPAFYWQHAVSLWR